MQDPPSNRPWGDPGRDGAERVQPARSVRPGRRRNRPWGARPPWAEGGDTQSEWGVQGQPRAGPARAQRPVQGPRSLVRCPGVGAGLGPGRQSSQAGRGGVSEGDLTGLGDAGRGRAGGHRDWGWGRGPGARRPHALPGPGAKAGRRAGGRPAVRRGAGPSPGTPSRARRGRERD